MLNLMAILIAFQPFNASLIYTGDQAGKGAAVTSFGCITAGNTALDPGGNMQVLYAALDETGMVLWSDSIHWNQSSEILSVTNVAETLVFTGSSSNQSTSEDALAWAVSPDCQQLWTFSLALPLQERFNSAAQGADGTVVCAGSTNSIGAGGNDVLMVALDETGNQVWRQTYGTTGEEAVYHISPCSDGGFIMACQAMTWGGGNGDYWIVRTDSAGDTLWTGTYGGPEFEYPWRVVQSGDCFYVAGNTLSYGEGSYDWWILKLDSGGNVIWSRTWGFENTDTCMALEATENGAIVAGASEPVLNMFQATAVSFSQDGDVTSEWFFQPGMIRSVAAVANGCFLMGGTAFTPDGALWALCVDSTGNAPEMGITPETSDRSILLSSNPASESVSVTLPGSGTGITVRDLSGKLVGSYSISENTGEIDVSELPVGIYTLFSDEGASTKLTVIR